MKIVDFEYFVGLDDDKEFETAFNKIQRIYVFNENDRINKDFALNTLMKLKEIMNIE